MRNPNFRFVGLWAKQYGAVNDGGPDFMVREEQASNVQAQTAVVGYNIRVLNTMVRNTAGVGLSNNQVILGAGTWLLRARAPAVTNSHRLTLYDATNAVGELMAKSNSSSQSGNVSTDSHVVAVVAFAVQTALEVRHWCQSGGQLGARILSGGAEVYTTLEGMRLG